MRRSGPVVAAGNHGTARGKALAKRRFRHDPAHRPGRGLRIIRVEVLDRILGDFGHGAEPGTCGWEPSLQSVDQRDSETLAARSEYEAVVLCEQCLQSCPADAAKLASDRP